MKNKIKELKDLDLDNNIIKKLKDINILNVLDLCNTKRKTLKKYNFTLDEINHIIIKLQLSGLDLSRK